MPRTTMPITNDLFESLAKTHVGDGQLPNMYFVADRGKIVAIMSEDVDALELALRLDGTVEDRLVGFIFPESAHGPDDSEAVDV